MKRSACLSVRSRMLAALCGALCLLLQAGPALAEGPTLANKDAGYTITLPDGWELTDNSQFLDGLMSGFSASDMESIKKNAQAAMMMVPGEDMRIFVVLPVDYAFLDIDKKDVQDLAKMEKLLTMQIRQELETGMKQAGMKTSDAQCPPVGVGIGMEMPIQEDVSLFGIMHIRLTKDHVIYAMGMRAGKDASKSRQMVEEIMALLQIDPEKNLTTE
ncbi:hypothetical protein LJC59_04360 [Desulfovibrio sp. OttesenSCG-928-A18]|nr:hypothetical protein [Desulfovibrio sp. OttesenSCG-928-A18]